VLTIVIEKSRLLLPRKKVMFNKTESDKRIEKVYYSKKN